MKVKIQYSDIYRGILARCPMNGVYNPLSWFNESFVKWFCCWTHNSNIHIMLFRELQQASVKYLRVSEVMYSREKIISDGCCPPTLRDMSNTS